MSVYLAIDLGAGSGRIIAGVVSEGKFSLDEINRFENIPEERDGGLFWNFENLWAGILEGLKLSVEKYGAEAIRSIGVDTWGVDYGLIDAAGDLLAVPRHYRDARNKQAMDEVCEVVSREEIFEKTGLQFMQINTLFQMAAAKKHEPELLHKAAQFLLIPDLINLRLTGKAFCERTNASTTQFYNPVKKRWSIKLFEKIGVPLEKTPQLIEAGESLGPVKDAIAAETGLLPHTEVVTVGSHDTASAVAAVPANGDKKFAYLSSGSWSLLGVELDQPILSDLVRKYNFTNEVGVFDTIRLLKNINGLWLVQECRRVWSEQGNQWSFAELAGMARTATPLKALVDPDDQRFSTRADMPQMVVDFCRESGQSIPESPAEILRTLVDSLAMKCAYVLKRLEEVIGHCVEVLHIIGGGGRDDMLNQAIANSINRPVIVGPYEATAAGNVMMQKVACGKLKSLEEGRAMIRSSFETKQFDPQDGDQWSAAYERFETLLPS
ncbi:rhamnulokinase [Akkermansiaceae bacterium]|nr:rhamnulokinase [Akkermansiaceae bacterium]